jgi:hypothetical protein
MAHCAYCTAETEMYDGGDVPICVECSDERNLKPKPPATEDRVRSTLIQDVVEATALKNEASGAFEILLDQFPSGLPHPDGSQRIKNASVRLSMARKGVMKAHNRLNDYLGRGIVPKDIKRSG